MVEGIEILSQTEIMTTPDWLFWVLIIGGSAIFILVGALIEWLMDSETAGYIIGFLVTALYLIVMCGTSIDSVPTGRYQYEAYIDESVRVEELYVHYDIVDRRDKIYILEEKEK